MICIFSRHGESQANIEKVFSNTGYRHGLTPKGAKQARLLAETLCQQYSHIKKIYCSPLKRAVETAMIVQEQLDVEVEHDLRLIEFYVGELEGKCDAASWELFHQVWEAWTVKGQYDAVIPGGERFFDIIQRMEAFLQERAQQYTAHDEILCISHGGVLKTALPYITGEKTLLQGRYLANTETLKVHASDGTYRLP